MDTITKFQEFLIKLVKDPDLPIFILFILISPTILNTLTVSVGIWYVLRKILADEKSEKTALLKELSDLKKETTMMAEIRKMLKDNSDEMKNDLGQRLASFEATLKEHNNLLITLNREVGELNGRKSKDDKAA